MKNLNWLKNATLTNCLKLEEAIPHTIPRNNIYLVKAALAKLWNFDPFLIKFGPKTEFKSYQVGLNHTSEYQKIQKILLELDFPVFYLYPWYYKEALASYYIENNLLPPDNLITPLYTLSDIFFLPEKLRIKIFHFKMDLYDYYHLHPLMPRIDINNLLPFFPLDRLIDLAKAYNYNGNFDKFSIVYAFKYITILESDIEKYLFHSKKLQGKLKIDGMQAERYVYYRIAYYYLIYGNKYPSRETIIRKWEERDPSVLDISMDRIKDIFGIYKLRKFNTFKNTYQLLSYIFSDEKFFFFLSQPRSCEREEDYYGETFNEWVLAYGNLISYKCYSPLELTESFILDEEDIPIYRVPETPNVQFPLQAIKDLLYTLETQDNYSLYNYESIYLLMLKLQEFKDLKSFVSILIPPSNPRELELVYHFFLRMFEAGMYQRGWRGPGYAYPMTTIETLETTQDEIDAAMTIPLNEMNDLLNKMRPRLSGEVKRLICVYRADTETFLTEPIREMIKNIRKGIYCVGGYSAFLIETAYFYIKMLNKSIPYFNYNEFEPTSTERD